MRKFSFECGRRLVGCIAFLLISWLSAAQKNPDKIYADLDLYTLQGICPLEEPPGDSSLKNIRCSFNSREQVKEILFRKSFYRWQDTRQANVYRNKEATILAFKVHKEAGFEKVIIFGAVERYYDTILILHDTIYFKEVMNNTVDAKIIYPEKNDTLVIKSFQKPFNSSAAKGGDFHTLLAFHMLWENNTNWDLTETYTYVSRQTHYELVSLTTSGKPREESYYLKLQEDIKKAGHSITWLLLSTMIEW